MTDYRSSALQDCLNNVRWDARGLVPAVTQSADSGRVLTLAWMNRAALAATIDSGFATYWSRSRGKLWRKGETSGNAQRIVAVRLDCDNDALLLEVEQIGGIACHTGRESCFHQILEDCNWVTRDPVLKDPNEMYSHE